MHDDDAPKELTPQEQMAALRQNFDHFVDYTAREMIELVMKSDPFLRAYAEEGKAAGQSVNLDSMVYVICHRLLLSGQSFGERVMANVADRLSIAAVLRL